MNNNPDILSPDQLDEARRYHREGLVGDLVDRAVDFAYLGLATFLLAMPLDSWLMHSAGVENRWTRLGLFFVLFTTVHIVISLPISFYWGHIVEHRYKMSRLTTAGWFWRYMKRQGLGLAMGLAMVELLFAVVWFIGPWWWLVAAAGSFLIGIAMGQLMPVLILPLFYKIKRLEDDTLRDRLAKLAEGTGLTVEGVYEMKLSVETVKANAMLAGLGRTRRVILGDTLLEGFTEDEIDIVFAHELGHHVHRHIWWLLLTGALMSVVGFYLCDRALAAWSLSSNEAVNYSNLPVSALPLFMFCFLIVSQLLEPLLHAMSRRFERQADRYALKATGDPSAFRSAFEKLARLNKADPDPPTWEVILFHSHPPISQRLAMAETETE